MNSRDKILHNLRQNAAGKKTISLPKTRDDEIFRAYPQTDKNLADIFSENLGKLNGQFYLCQTGEQFRDNFSNVCTLEKIQSIVLQPEGRLRDLLPEIPGVSFVLYDKPISSAQFANFDCGITVADYLVARTGSVILKSSSAGGRRLSVLPPVHIVIADKKQLVASLDSVFTENGEYLSDSSFATIITGPSRTSDIEKQLVLGAHGPKSLIVFLLDF